MRRFLMLVVAGCAAATLFSGNALANHSGPEDVATGRGETSATTTSIILPVDIPGGGPFTGFRCTDPGIAPFFSVCVQTTTAAFSKFDFDARLSSQEATTPLGEPHGHMKLDFSSTTTTQSFLFGQPTSAAITTSQSFIATAEVTCLTVVNNRAALSGRVTRFSGTVAPQRGLFFNATDNTIAGIQVTPDRFAGTLQPEALQVCPAPSADAPITKGNILIEDN